MAFLKAPRRKNLFWMCSISILIFGSSIMAGSAQHTPRTFLATDEKRNAETPSTPSVIPLASKPGEWITQAWTKSDTEFLTMEADIRQRIRSGQSPNSVLAKERENARTHPADFAAQFRWLYAATQAADDSGGIDYQAIEAVARQDPGNVRAVARIRFAAGILQGPNKYHPDLDRVGERLLVTDPQDQWVHGHLIYDMANGVAVEKAETLAQKWVAEEPHSPVAHSVLAYVYQNLWAKSHHQRVYAEKVIAEQQNFLRLAPPNDPGRKVANYLITAFQRRLAATH